MMAAPQPAAGPPEKPPTLEALAAEAGLIHEQIARHAALAGVLYRDADDALEDDRRWLMGMLADGLALLDGRADALQARMRQSARVTSGPSRPLRIVVKGRQRGGV